ncbi:MAG: hypothetical protein KGL36_06745 [Gammaproteobacteria bacterium]|nr:hypothetical protein [Gammaproteobacteria bacterium]
MIDPDRGELERYLCGDDELSAAYRRLPQPTPPRILDRRVLDRARGATRRRPWREGLAYAAGVLLALAVLFAFEIQPRGPRVADDAPHFVRTAMRTDRATAWPMPGPIVDRAIGSARCAPPDTRPPAIAGESAGPAPGTPSRVAEARPKLREPCSPRGRLR